MPHLCQVLPEYSRFLARREKANSVLSLATYKVGAAVYTQTSVKGLIQANQSARGV